MSDTSNIKFISDISDTTIGGELIWFPPQCRLRAEFLSNRLFTSYQRNSTSK